ncbi:4Fe-4S binding protein [Hydrogenimonas sp.]
MRKEDIVVAGDFSFDYFKCLRSEYAKNDCRLCIDLCPEEAMVFDRKRLTLDAERCTGCTACMGVCPTEAFASERFDPERFVVRFSEGENPNISCEASPPCLAALSAEHFIAIALRKEGPVACDLTRCETCELNRDGKVLQAIEAAMEEANAFLSLLGNERRIGREPLPWEREEASTEDAEEERAEVDESRRALFRRLAAPVAAPEAQPAQEEAQEVDVDFSDLTVGEEERQPLKRILLKKSLKKVAGTFPEATTARAAFSFVSGKKIDAMACTNCQECAMFCPTGALSILQDNTGIIFQLGKCIACGICNDVCQPRAITDDDAFDLVSFAFDRMSLLVKHELAICEECKVAFPYKGGEKVCDRCRDFKNNFSDLFTLARDME